MADSRTRLSPSCQAFLAAILDDYPTVDPAPLRQRPSRHRPNPHGRGGQQGRTTDRSHDEWLNAITDDDGLSPGLDAFLDAILDEDGCALCVPRAQQSRRTTNVSHDERPNTITSHSPPTARDLFIAAVLREHNFNPDEPRDAWGRWTKDGPESDRLKTNASGAPILLAQPAGASASPAAAAPINDMAGLLQLLADTQFQGDLAKAKAKLDQYITDLAFVLKNPTLGDYPGMNLGLFDPGDGPQSKMFPFSDEITDADRKKAEGEAIRNLPGYLTGAHPNDPLQDRLNGMFSQLQQLRKQEQNGALTRDERYAVDDLTLWGNAFFDAYRRAAMGETHLGQLGRALLQPDTMNGLIGAFGGFAGIAASGQRLGKAAPGAMPEMAPGARPAEPAPPSAPGAVQNPGRPFPPDAKPGQSLQNIDPNTLQAGRADLVGGKLATQRQLIQQGVPRTTPIQVTPSGIIWDGNHGAAAAAKAGAPVNVQVIEPPFSIPSKGPVTKLPIRP